MSRLDSAIGWVTTGRGRRVQAWWNIIICACIFLGAASVGIAKDPMFLVVAIGAAAMEVQFIRQLVRVGRTPELDSDFEAE
ncbi:hypothetical protein [Agromyces sp. NPDC058064]|uniref:hypothetical protein n=1 Tax=Agromyces sp. NPDC058064 TaxID=3346322 RepID=UPI0036DC4BE9